MYHTLKSDNIEIFCIELRLMRHASSKSAFSEKSAPGRGWHHSVMESVGSQEPKTVPNSNIPFFEGSKAKWLNLALTNTLA